MARINFPRVSNIDHKLGKPRCQIAIVSGMPRWLRDSHPMSLVTSPPPSDHPVYTISNLVEKRRDVLRFARLLPVGQRRNQLRQTASALRTLFKKNGWLDANTSDEIAMSESQMPTLPTPPGCPRCQAGTTVQRTARSRFGFEHLTLRCTKCGHIHEAQVQIA